MACDACRHAAIMGVLNQTGGIGPKGVGGGTTVIVGNFPSVKVPHSLK